MLNKHPSNRTIPGKTHVNSNRNFAACERPSARNVTSSKDNFKKTALFLPYWSLEDVEKGLKDGSLMQGPLRINVKNFEEAYIADPTGENDIFISGIANRNRALHGDIVAVRLKDRQNWRVLTSPSALSRTADPSTSNDRVAPAKKSVVKYSRDTLVRINEFCASSHPLDEAAAASLDNLSLRRTSEVSGGNVPSSTPPRVILKRPTPVPGTLRSGNVANKNSRINITPTKKQYTKVSDLNTASVEDQSLLKTAEVVYILEKKHTRLACGTLKPMQDMNAKWALFSPSDSKVPRLMVPVQECPAQLLARPQDFERMLFIACLVEWNENSKFARGALVKHLGEMGRVEPETEGMLLEYGFKSGDFDTTVLECLPKISAGSMWNIAEEEFAYREDFRQELLFSIDPATARDLDDALHVKHLDDGCYEVGVHIADVSFFVKSHTALDEAAKDRATSVYLVHKVIPMLPRLLCEELCSLNPGVDRLAFSVVWKMNEKGEIYAERFTRSVIRSCCKLNYDVAQGFIQQPERQWTAEEVPPISGHWSVDDINRTVNILHRIATKLRQKRHDSGALRIDQPKLSFGLDKETGLPNGCKIYELKDSNRLIEEFMLLANMAVAHRIYKFYPDIALLRRHPLPKGKVLKETIELCRQSGFELDGTTSSSLQQSLLRCKGESGRAKAVWAVLMQLISKCMKLALYFCTGSLDDDSLYHHYALNVPLYTHFTSPIRRYPDIIVHRLLAASLEYDAAPALSTEQMQKISEHCNDKKYAAKAVSDLSSEMFFSIFIKQCGPLEESGSIMGIMDRSFDVLIIRFGLTRRVYCDKLKGVIWSFEGDKENAIGTMTLTHLNNNKATVLNIFDQIEVILFCREDSVKFEITLKMDTTDIVGHEAPAIRTNNVVEAFIDLEIAD